MKVRWSLAAIGAALMMVGMSAPAMAQSTFVCGTDPVTNPYDKDVIAAGLEAIAVNLRCVEDNDPPNLGLWNTATIWQKGAKGSGNGCDVHASLARKLLEFRDFGGDKKPPKNKNETNVAAGASWDVANEKYEAAFDKLESFENDAKKGKLNESNNHASGQLSVLLVDIYKAKMCVNHFRM